MPTDIKVSHKTGTWYDNNVQPAEYHYTNDIGIITLPADKGHLAISVYTSSDKGSSTQKQSEAMAKATKIIYDEFTK